MKYDIKEIKKALELAKNVTDVNVGFDPHERLIITFTDPNGEIPHEVIIYPMRNDTSSKFAEVKITKRL